MKADITPDGFLKITAETHTEAYALKCWLAGYSQIVPVVVPKSGLAVDYTLQSLQANVSE